MHIFKIEHRIPTRILCNTESIRHYCSVEYFHAIGPLLCKLCQTITVQVFSTLLPKCGGNGVHFRFRLFSFKTTVRPYYLFICSLRVLVEKELWFVHFKLIRCFFCFETKLPVISTTETLYKRRKSKEKKNR